MSGSSSDCVYQSSLGKFNKREKSSSVCAMDNRQINKNLLGHSLPTGLILAGDLIITTSCLMLASSKLRCVCVFVCTLARVLEFRCSTSGALLWKTINGSHRWPIAGYHTAVGQQVGFNVCTAAISSNQPYSERAAHANWKQPLIAAHFISVQCIY